MRTSVGFIETTQKLILVRIREEMKKEEYDWLLDYWCQCIDLFTKYLRR